MPEQQAPSSPVVPPTRPARRWLGTALALAGLLLLGGGAWYLTHRPPATDAAAAAGGGQPGGGGPGARGGGGGRGGGMASTVAIAVARRIDVPVYFNSLGTVTSAATVVVRPQVSGVLQQVLFTEGQMVTKGQLLAQIDPRPFEMTLMQASGARIRDEAQLQNAKLTLERYRTLLAQDSIARQDVDTQAALVKQLEGSVTADRAVEGTARLNLSYARIVAPVAGRVGLRAVDAGNIVSSSDANGIATITQVAPIDVQFSVPQDRVPELLQQMRAGLPARAFDRTRSTLLEEGRFAILDNQVDTTTGTVKAKARFLNREGLLFPNQFVNLQLQVRIIKDAVVVPVSAVRNGAAGDFVYVLNDDRTVSQRPVKRGEATPDQVVISSGLEGGERVVTEGADRLKDGARVQLGGDRASAPGRGASRPGGASRPDGASGPGGGRWREARAAGAAGASWPAGAASAAWPEGASRPRRSERRASAPDS
ncbi:efflux RND transporter periplasmic adaptor subunit [Aquincola sp. S2]|uniref:Efflux RND transporter periplasmic adaptor subunit n=1 Tax=Pseudaquabacterium terrae TaxID=2732868 RepID=A0ABX2EMX2_9BURK|nr:efflux RND transporter periplasmic adaptor subunit [Aquabacterium terrae]NRF70035.1 efflux RND transporter periplasmic adaptor subunit [Aquabacterium terrae]